MNVRLELMDVTLMQTVRTPQEVTPVHAIQAILEMDKHARTSTNVHRALTIVIPMQDVQIQLEVLHALDAVFQDSRRFVKNLGLYYFLTLLVFTNSNALRFLNS